jgi:hypothetical protein
MANGTDKSIGMKSVIFLTRFGEHGIVAPPYRL